MHDTESPTHQPTSSTPGIPDKAGQGTKLWQRILLGIILLLSAFFNFFQLGQNHFVDITTSVNSYYAAAVKSMALNWHNFFFAAFDPQGFLAIDKPPLGFWFQVLSTRIFGFSEWSLLLPEALAGVGSVAVLYILVRRTFGPNAGLIAALTLTLTPISVVTSRNNTIDSLLVLVLLFATWALSLAAETGKLRWLLISALLVGLGFNIKMLEAYLVLPAFALTYILSAPRQLRIRLLHLVLAALLLLVVSFSWITAVDLVPTGQRPYVSSTQHDSELELALGYNGLSRVFGVSGGSNANNETGTQINTTSILVIFGIVSTGTPSPLRLINPLLGGQIGWLLLFAIIGLLAACTAQRWKRPFSSLESSQRGLLLWGSWFIVLLLFFSFALFDHPYYLVTFAPAISALVGIGSVAMYRAYKVQAGWRSWLLPITLLGSALDEGSILFPFPTLAHLLAPIILTLSILLAVALIIGLLVRRFPGSALVRPLTIVSLLVLLIAPTVWAALPFATGTDTINPTAGPPLAPNLLTIIAHAIIPESEHAQPALEHYLLANQGQARYLVATLDASTAAPFILDTGKSAIAYGGYNGFDQILTGQQTAALVQQGEVRFFLLPLFIPIKADTLSSSARKILAALTPESSNGTFTVRPQPALTQWVTSHCTLVPRQVAEPGSTGPGNTVDLGEGSGTVLTQLFACAPHS